LYYFSCLIFEALVELLFFGVRHAPKLQAVPVFLQGLVVGVEV
tara:strand:- start:247 stop:375 length:129 start_codon:yes stop_codon:yes gene_type:complete